MSITRPTAMTDEHVKKILESGARITLNDRRLDGAIVWVLGTVGALFVGFIAWMANNQLQLAEAQASDRAASTAQIAELKQQTALLQANLSYLQRDGERTDLAQDGRMTLHEEQIKQLERRAR